MQVVSPFVYSFQNFNNPDYVFKGRSAATVFFREYPRSGCGFVLLFVVVYMAMMPLGIGFVTQGTNGGEVLRGLLFVGFFFVPFILFSILVRIWYSTIGPTLEAPSLEIASIHVKANDRLRLRYIQPVRRDIQLLGGEVQLVLREAVRYSCGTDICYDSYDHVLAQQSLLPQHLLPGSRIDAQHLLDMPAETMHSFAESSNKIGWLIRVEMRFDRINQVEEVFQLYVP